MKIDEAFRKAIKAYFEETSLNELNSLSDESFKYTKSYFDSVEKEFGLSDEKARDEKKLDKKKDK